MSCASQPNRVTSSVTHQIYIDGDPAWIKAEVEVSVEENETLDEANIRATKAVNDHVVANIEAAVQRIKEFQE